MKKIYNGITEIKYMYFANWVSLEIKSICCLLNNEKDKKHFCCWQDYSIHAYRGLYLDYGTSAKVPAKPKSINEKEYS